MDQGLKAEIRSNFVTVQPPRHKGTKKGYEFEPLTKREESIAKKIVYAANAIHKILGPGLS